MDSITLQWSELLDDLYNYLHKSEIEECNKDENVDIEFIRTLNQLKLKTIETKKMLTMDWKDLQYKKPKAIKKKVKQKKSSQVVQAKYPISKTNFSASDWEEYQQWIKQQKKASEPPKEKKVNSTKKKHKKAASKPKKALTRKEEYYQELEHPLWKEKRKVILERDRYQCRICGSKHNLVVHHIKYSEGKKAWQYPNLDLITLCRDCHDRVHNNKNHELNPFKEK